MSGAPPPPARAPAHSPAARPPVSSRHETIAFAARKVGKRFGMGKEVMLHIDPDGALRIENPGRRAEQRRREINIPADALQSAVIKGSLRLRLVYLDRDGTDVPYSGSATKRLLEFDTPLHREQFIAVLQRRVAGEDDPEDISIAAARHLTVRAGTSAHGTEESSASSPSASPTTSSPTLTPQSSDHATDSNDNHQHATTIFLRHKRPFIPGHATPTTTTLQAPVSCLDPRRHGHASRWRALYEPH